MEIKTLAQILEESSDNTKQSSTRRRKSEANNKQNKQRQNKSAPWAERASSHGFAVPDSLVDPSDLDRTETTESANPFDPHSASKHSDNAQSRSEALKQYKSDLEDADDHLFFEKHISVSSESNFQPNSQDGGGSRIRKKRKKKKQFHPASPYKPKIETVEPAKEPDPNSIKSILAQVKSEHSQNINSEDSNSDLNNTIHNDSDAQPNSVLLNKFMQVSENKKHADTNAVTGIDNLPAALRSYLKTPEQRQAEKEEIKANSRLRWLAFYYLSRREHSAGELRQKLIDKEQDPKKIDELLEEFAEKGYQSDYRTALMLIREGIRKGRGRIRIKNDFYKRKIALPSNIDELIDMATEDNAEFTDVISENELVNGVDWLRLAVEARVKKYGNDIPTDQKIKARQLRFMQYRGFKPDICFQALNHNLETLEDRF